MTEWQRHQLDHMQIMCTLLQTDNHTNTSSFPDTQLAVSQCQKTESNINGHTHMQ